MSGAITTVKTPFGWKHLPFNACQANDRQRQLLIKLMTPKIDGFITSA